MIQYTLSLTKGGDSLLIIFISLYFKIYTIIEQVCFFKDEKLTIIQYHSHNTKPDSYSLAKIQPFL